MHNCKNSNFLTYGFNKNSNYQIINVKKNVNYSLFDLKVKFGGDKFYKINKS